LTNSHPALKNGAVVLGLVLLGLAGNYFKYPLFLSIDFLFGSIFALLALQFFGLTYGVIAAALISSYTTVLWNHPYAMIILTAEVAVVGWLMQRRKMRMLTADVLYWLVIGMPLGYVFFYWVMNTPQSSTYVIMVKQAVNGLANAIVARMLFAGLAGRFQSRQLSLGELIGNLLTAFLLFPALLMLAVGSRTDFSDADQGIRNALQQKSHVTKHRLQDWVASRTQVVLSLTELAATLTPTQMQDRLMQARASDANFLRIGMRDTESVIVAYAPPVDESGQSNIGKKFPERPYIAELKRSLKPMLAEVVVGRIDAPQPVVILLAPVLRLGQYAGYINSVLRLDRIRQHLENSAEGSSLIYSLLDTKGKVILSNRSDQKMNTPFDRGRGRLTASVDGVAQWIPDLPPNTSISDQWATSHYVAQSDVGDKGGWQLILEQPVAPFQKMLYESYTTKLALLFAITLVALLLAEVLSRRVTLSIERLADLSHDLPLKLVNDGTQIAWPQSGISDANDLTNNFKAMAFTLETQLKEIRAINESLDQRVQARTQELAASESRFRAVIDLMPDAIALHRDGKLLFVNPACVQMFGATTAQGLLDKPVMDLVHPLYRDLVRGRMQAAAEHGMVAQKIEEQYLKVDGTTFDVEAQGQPIILEGKLAMLSVLRDITERKQAGLKLQLAADVFRHAREGITITNSDGMIIDVNDSFTRITGYSREEAIGQNPRILKSGRQESAFYSELWGTLAAQGHWSGEIWNRRKTGEVYAELIAISAVRDANGVTQQYVALFSDITALKEHQEQLEHIAHFDALTNLPNRVLLADRLQQGMAQVQRRGLHLAVAYLDLDGFKTINDVNGHEVGDQVLIALATRMRQALREGDTLARLGGDEFVAVLIDLEDMSASLPMLSRMLAAASQPIQVGDLMCQVSASIGVTFYPQEQDIDADQLMRQADQAMYQAKVAGKNRYQIFDAAHDSHLRGHHESLERIRVALQNNEFFLYYQPKVNMRTGVIVGAEALIRWQHPEKGLLAPGAFLPVIEDHPLAVRVGEWVIDTALTQIERWHAVGLDLAISVNIGARQLQQGDFVERLRCILAEHPGVRPGSLTLEVLETSALEDIATVSQVIESCAQMGVMFALDDFGTGYSSLTYLKRLRVALLKIDQSFVRDMLDDPDDLAILEGVIGLAAAFRRLVIAEGVETVEHGTLLLQLGCELAQGYGIARPMPAHEMPAWAATWKPNAAWTSRAL
jgi:diguanylate cyclase (GGDEF)-like protein/PAS domain S-box-containing protein